MAPDLADAVLREQPGDDRRLAILAEPRLTYLALRRAVRARARQWGDLRGWRVAVCTGEPVSFVTAVVTLDLVGAHAFLVGDRGPSESLELLRHHHIDASIVRNGLAQPVDSLGAPPPGSAEPLVTLFTSGTTGTPKAIRHTWGTLMGPVRLDPHFRDHRWLLAYPLNRYAGLQVFLQAILNRSSLVAPGGYEPSAVLHAMRTHHVTHASATPTLWRRLLIFGRREEFEGIHLEQITLGGEIATQEVLDRLRRTFPAARIVHVYASTELGRLFSVTDGREGFPGSWLERPASNRAELRIVDGQLYARSPYAMMRPGGGRPHTPAHDWLPTGDSVEIRGDRVFFFGRNSEVINVGGAKVSPIRVEQVLLDVPFVREARVYAEKSSLAGELVAADIVLVPDVKQDAARSELLRHAREQLAAYEVPRVIRFLDELPRSDAYKTIRSATA